MATARTRTEKAPLPPTFGKRNGDGKLVARECATPECGDRVVAPVTVTRVWCGYCTQRFARRELDPRTAAVR